MCFQKSRALGDIYFLGGRAEKKGRAIRFVGSQDDSDIEQGLRTPYCGDTFQVFIIFSRGVHSYSFRGEVMLR